MMLSSIGISNFKGLRAATFIPSTFACLVGENNAGKSSVLQAIVYSLNRPPSIHIDLFYDPTLPIVFDISFTGIMREDIDRLAEEHRDRIERLIDAGCMDLRVKYPPGQKCEITIKTVAPIDERYQTDHIAALLQGKRGPSIRECITTAFPEFSDGVPDALNITQAKEYLNHRIAALPADNFRPSYTTLPSGIPSSISALLPEAIYIPAVKNLGDDTKTSQSTPFGRLLGLLLEDMTPDLDRVNNSLRDLNSMLNRVAGAEEPDGRHPKVIELESIVEAFLGEHFPRVRLELHVPPPELKAILNTAQIFVDDGARDLIDNKGDGIKRSLTFALLRTYVHNLGIKKTDGAGDRPRPLLFLFEEPELYLHPKSQRVLFQTLGRISATHQVVVTTHSPLFFAPGVTASFVRIAKMSAAPKPVGTLFPITFSLDEHSAEVFRLACFENAEAAFFSQRVVLFEGESDDAYCRHIAPHLNPAWNFDQKNVAMVRVSGKGNFSKFRRFFEAFGIEVKIVADLDAIFDGHHHLGGLNEYTDLRTSAIRHIDAHIAAGGIRAEPNARQVRARVHSDSWRRRYDTAKGALRQVRETATVTEDLLTLIDGLFTWEDDVARVRACRDDPACCQFLVATLDHLRQGGVCVLSRGAIEDYYPAGTPDSGPKPDRALVAAGLVTSRDVALGLSTPLAAGRECELSEVFTEIFRDL